jgi:acetyl esterase/lipase
MASDSVRLWEEGGQPGGENAEGLPRLTPFLVDGSGARAAIVVCPGGGYGARAAHEGEPVARWLNGIGLHAFLLDYRVAPQRPEGGTLHPLPLLDAQCAIRTVRHRAVEWGVDTDKVGILGFSAGGHLAATAATQWDRGDATAADPVERQSCRPDAAVLCYAVLSFVEYAHAGSMRNLLGENATLAQRRALSAELRVTAETPPTFLWHTAEDAGVPPENSLNYAAALARHGVPFSLHVFPRGAHGLGLADGKVKPVSDAQVGMWPQLCATWLSGLGWRE